MKSTAHYNRRILIVDDNPSIHGDFCKLLFAERNIVFVALNADAFFDVPGRHHALTVSKQRPRLDRFGPGARFLIGEQRHRREGIGPMAALATSLQDWRDVFGERGG